MNFKELLLKKLQTQFGHKNYRNDMQKEATESIYRGIKNVFIRMPSGFGKSLCFQLPLVLQDHKFAIVISPSIVQAKIQVNYLKSRNILAYFWNAHTNNDMQIRLKKEITSKKPKLKLLYTTPEKFASPHFQFILSNIKSKNLSYLVIEEAHCISALGYNHRKSYEKLIKLNFECYNVPLIAVTATANKQVQKDIIMKLKMKVPLKFIMPVFKSNIFHDVWCVEILSNPMLHLLNFIKQKSGLNEASKNKISKFGIIICKDQQTVLSLARYLSFNGISTSPYGIGDKMQNDLQIQKQWNAGKINVIITKTSFNLDFYKKPVRYFVHWYNFSTLGKYYEESGRAGYDDNRCSRIYFSLHEIFQNTIKSKMSITQNSQTMIEEEYSFLIGIGCRHIKLARYFGDPDPKCMKHCDFCKNKQLVFQKVQQINELIQECRYDLTSSQQYCMDLDSCTLYKSTQCTMPSFPEHLSVKSISLNLQHFDKYTNYSMNYSQHTETMIVKEKCFKKLNQKKLNILSESDNSNNNKQIGNISLNVKLRCFPEKSVVNNYEYSDSISDRFSDTTNKSVNVSGLKFTSEQKHIRHCNCRPSECMNKSFYLISTKAKFQMKEIKNILLKNKITRLELTDNQFKTNTSECEHIRKKSFSDTNSSASLQMIKIKEILSVKSIQYHRRSKETSYKHQQKRGIINSEILTNARLQMNAIKEILSPVNCSKLIPVVLPVINCRSCNSANL